MSIVASLDAAAATSAPVIRRVLSPWLGNQDTDDLVQQVRIRAADKAVTYDPARGSVHGFVHGIARNVAREHVRHAGRAAGRVATVDSAVLDAFPDRQPGVLDAMVTRFETDRLLASIANVVGDRDWQITTLLCLDGHTVIDVAEKLGISPRTVRSARAWAGDVAHTIRAAHAFADAGQPGTPQAVVDCFPVGSRLAAIAANDPAVLDLIPSSELRRLLPRVRTLWAAVAEIVGC